MDPQSILANLRSNQLPEPVSIWPLAPGWWILASIILVGLLWITYTGIRSRIKNRYRREGLKIAGQILQHYETHGNRRQYAHDCNGLLKKVALHAFPRQEIASLVGAQWLDFLYQTSGNALFKQSPAYALGSIRFDPAQEPDVRQLYPLTKSWIKKHHA